MSRPTTHSPSSTPALESTPRYPPIPGGTSPWPIPPPRLGADQGALNSKRPATSPHRQRRDRGPAGLAPLVRSDHEPQVGHGIGVHRPVLPLECRAGRAEVV